MIMSPLQKLRYSLYGVAMIVVVIALVVVSLMEFNRDFDSHDNVTLESSRAGLLMTEGDAVKMRGVTVGRVTSVSVTTAGARIQLGIDPGELHLIPADVSARIVPPTFFGAKYVDLVPRNDDITFTALRTDAVIRGARVTVEINNTFEHLMELLQAAQPAKVNAALAALSQSLDGNGNRLGQLIVQVDRYLKGINPTLSATLADNLRRARSVLGTYSAVTPDLLKTLDNVSVTSDAIQANQTALTAFLAGLTTVSRDTTTFLNTNDEPLHAALSELYTPLTTLARYSPEVPCLFTEIADTIVPFVQKLAAGPLYRGLNVLLAFLPPIKPYRYPQDLPKVAADIGPHCYDLPNVSLNGTTTFHHVNLDDGSDPYTGVSRGTDLPYLLNILFGEFGAAGS